MRAYQLSQPGSIDGLVQVERPMPKPAYRQVLVKVLACSLNYRDLAIVLGRYRMPTKPDLVPLSDGAGEVVEVGPGVTSVKAGDRVASCFFQRWVGGRAPPDVQRGALGGSIDGMLSEYVVLEEDGVVPLPEPLWIDEGATLPCASVTAWHALVDHGHTIAGDRILVLGTGGVSIFGLQLARALGAEVVVTSSSDDKLERARELGATHLINYAQMPEWDQAVLEATGGVDQVIEIGGAGTMARSISALRVGGRISMIGVLGGAAEINPMLIMQKRANVQGISVGSKQMFAAMIRAITVNRIRPVIDKVFGFDEVQAAYRHMQSAAHFGKIVIRVA